VGTLQDLPEETLFSIGRIKTGANKIKPPFVKQAEEKQRRRGSPRCGLLGVRCFNQKCPQHHQKTDVDKAKKTSGRRVGKRWGGTFSRR